MPERRADATVGAAVDWIGQQTGKWFGWVHVFDPHAPYAPPAEWQARYADRRLRRRSRVDRCRARRRSSRALDGAIAADARHRHRGPRRKPGRTRRDDPRHLRVRSDAARAADRRGGHAGRGRQGAARTSTAPARHVDIVPTSSTPSARRGADVAGRSLCRDQRRRSRRSPSYFESMMPVLARGWAPLRGVIVSRDKLIDLPIRELYDLGADPRELQNLAALAGRRASTCSLNLLRGIQHRSRRTGRRRKARRRASGCARSATPAAVRSCRAIGTPRPTTRSGLIELDKTAAPRERAFVARQAGRSRRDLSGPDQPPAGPGRRVSAAWRSCCGRPASRTPRSRRSNWR